MGHTTTNAFTHKATESNCSDQHRQEILVQLVAANQGRLFSFIYALLPDPEQARDVLQETNLLVWRKADEFVEGTNFWAWASKIAHFKVLSHCRAIQRDRHVFDELLVNELASTSAASDDQDDRRGHALRNCLNKLRRPQRELLHLRYTAGLSVSTLAAQLGLSADAVGMRLHRVRQSLLKCIQRKLTEEPTQ